jgi:hypothetical protein
MAGIPCSGFYGLRGTDMRSMLTVLVFGGLVNWASVTVSPPAQAQSFTPGESVLTYDVVDEFSRRTNNNSVVWSYRYSTTGVRDGNYQPLPKPTILDENWTSNGKPVKIYYWHDASQFNGYPYIAANQSRAELSRGGCCGAIFQPPFSMMVDPGTLLPVVSFLAPYDGVVLINYSFTHIDCHGGNGINYYVDFNGRGRKTKNLASGHLQSSSCETPDTTGSQVFPHVRVNTGDRINFIIDNNGEYQYDSSALTARVTYVPVPPPPPSSPVAAVRGR